MAAEFYKGESLLLRFATKVPAEGARPTITGFDIKVVIQGFFAQVTIKDDYTFEAYYAPTITKLFQPKCDVVLQLVKDSNTTIGKVSQITAIDPINGKVIDAIESVDLTVIIDSNVFEFDVDMHNIFTYADLTAEQKQDIIQGITAQAEGLFVQLNSAIDNANDIIYILNQFHTQAEAQESNRQTAETNRGTAEQTRQTNETNRQTAETNRGNAEQTRQTNETTRQSAETSREGAEQTRQSNETSRQSAETNRGSAESTRQTNETARQAAETARNVASNIYNVTLAVPLSAGQYYTSTTARAAVPVGVRKRGLELVYETSAGVWFSERFIGSDVAAWTTATNWERLPMTADFQAFLPAVPFSNRVLADGGFVRNKQALFDSYKTALDLLPNTVLAFSPEIGVKQSVNGLVYKASKLYDMSPLSNDANQATAANQPYIGGNIAPNERMWLWGDTSRLVFNDITFTATDKWSVSVVSDDYGNIIYLRDGLYSFLARYGFRNASNQTVTFTKDLPRFYTKRLYFVAKGDGTLQVWVNGVLSEIITNPTNVIFNSVLNTSSGFGKAKLKSLRIFNKDLSKSEIEGLDKFLASIYPEHETTNIGSQAWLTSNHLGNVTSDGFVIPEVQSNDATSNPELITNAADRDFSSDTGFWTKTAQVTIGGGVCNIKSTDGSAQGISRSGLLTAGKVYKKTYDIIANRGGSLSIVSGSTTINIDSAVGVGKVAYFVAGFTSESIQRNTGVTDIDIDNISTKEVGWADSQAVYDYYISVGKSVTEATKAAAMCCKYNNSDDNAAVFGYLYNWWAVYLFSLYPPKGLRVPTKADLGQKSTTLGGSSVAGGKLKKEGFAYWASPNAGATNESGFTALGAGFRTEAGIFSNASGIIGFWASTQVNASVADFIRLFSADSTADINVALKARGYSLRFLKNAPVGDLFEEIDTTTFTQNIATSQRELSVKFGYSIEVIKVYSNTNLTNIKVEARTTAGVLLATLLPTGSTTAGVPFEFKVTQGMPIQFQDYKLWITATGNSGDGMRVICNTKKSIL